MERDVLAAIDFRADVPTPYVVLRILVCRQPIDAAVLRAAQVSGWASCVMARCRLACHVCVCVCLDARPGVHVYACIFPLVCVDPP